MNARNIATRLRRGGLSRWAGPVLLLALVPLVSSIGGASIPDGNGVIHTCYDRDGQLRVIDTADPPGCKALEKPLSWNQQGEKGDKGDKGDDGVISAVHRYRFTGPSDVPANQTENVMTTVPPLGPGFYLITAKTVINSEPGKHSVCELKINAGGGATTADLSAHSPGGTQVTHNLQSNLGTPYPTTVTLDCTAAGKWTAGTTKLAAILVQQIDNAEFP